VAILRIPDRELLHPPIRRLVEWLCRCIVRERWREAHGTMAPHGEGLVNVSRNVAALSKVVA